MKSNAFAGALLMAVLLIVVLGCDQGINDWNSSAKVSGYVYTGPDHTTGVPGVMVIIEGDEAAENPYTGPDRWFRTNEDGYFEGFVFLGYSEEDTSYNYLADLDVAYFTDNWSFRWGGGITVAPGSHFTLPPVDLTMIGGE